MIWGLLRAAGSRNRQSAPMFLRLIFEPRNPLVSKITGDIAREPQARSLAAISLSRNNPQIISTPLDHWHLMATKRAKPVSMRYSSSSAIFEHQHVWSVNVRYQWRKAVGGDKKRGGGLVISRGALNGLPLRAQREGDPFYDYERSDCKISSDERHCVPWPARRSAFCRSPQLFVPEAD